MKTFYSAADIEEMAAQGIHELAVDEDTVLTSVARERAAQLGVRLMQPGQGGGASGASAPRPAAAVNPAKPKGCQHGPLTGGGATAGAASRQASSSPVVDELIGAVKQLAGRSNQGG